MGPSGGRVDLSCGPRQLSRRSTTIVTLIAGTLARSLLSTALDQVDTDAATITVLLDAVPGTYERAQQGLADVRDGRVIRLDEL
jgi:hypothetical protein